MSEDFFEGEDFSVKEVVEHDNHEVVIEVLIVQETNEEADFF